jgi:lysozyme family protein
MSLNSDKAIEKVLKIEGNFVNNPLDRGGATNFGITQKTYESYVGRKVSVSEIENMRVDEAREIYKRNYWDAIGGDYITSFPVAYIIFDQAVNRGVSSALRQACKVAEVVQEGSINSAIIKAINMYDPELFIMEYLSASEDFYIALVAKDPTQKVFIKGWLNRVDKIRTYAEAQMGQAVAIVQETLNENPWIYALPAVAILGVVGYYFMIIKKGKK